MPSLEVLLSEDERAEELRRDVRAGLTASPKRLRSRWVWDERGTALFDAITRLPEYYLTRCERAILETRAPAIARLARSKVVIELGSGSSEKTLLLLDALAAGSTLRRFVALDVSEAALRTSAPLLAERYPSVDIRAVVGDFERHLPAVVEAGPQLVVLLGSTLGALEPDERAGLLRAAVSALGPDGVFLLGLDLVKRADRIEAAYNDAGGLSAALAGNVLHVLNRELGATFQPGRFRYEGRWVPGEERMEMWLRSTVDQVVSIPALALEVAFPAGEALRSEISTKFRREGIEAELAAAGLELRSWWTDAAADFALCLAGPPS